MDLTFSVPILKQPTIPLPVVIFSNRNEQDKEIRAEEALSFAEFVWSLQILFWFSDSMNTTAWLFLIELS